MLRPFDIFILSNDFIIKFYFVFSKLFEYFLVLDYYKFVLFSMFKLNSYRIHNIFNWEGGKVDDIQV